MIRFSLLLVAIMFQIIILPPATYGQVGVIVAGNETEWYSGDGGPATAAAMAQPSDVYLSKKTNNFYIADHLNHVVRKVNTAGIITTVAGNHTNGYSGDGGPATNAAISFPLGVAVDAQENIYVSNGEFIRKIDTNGIITTFAGGGTSSSDGIPATAAGLSGMYSLTADNAGNIYLTASGNSKIRKIDTSGIITTIAGTDTYGFSGDGGPATAAELWAPMGIRLDKYRNIFFSDYYNHRVRKIDTNGIITTIAGGGTVYGDGVATAVALDLPSGIGVDKYGTVYFSEDLSAVIRKIDTTGMLTTIISGWYRLGPEGIDMDTSADLFFANADDDNIVKYYPNCLPVIHGPPGVCLGDSASFTTNLTGGIFTNTGGKIIMDTLPGMAIGVSPGEDVFTYTITNDCGTNSTSVSVSVDTSLPVHGILGTYTVCVGGMQLVSDSTAYGVWSATNPDVTTNYMGEVFGIFPGLDTLVYTISNSCGPFSSIHSFSVLPVYDPGTITGPDTLCQGTEVTFSDSVSGGIWSSYNSDVLAGSTGTCMVEWHGTDTIKYTVSASCPLYATKFVVIEAPPLPGTILGPDSVCIGDSIGLTGYPGSMVWACSNGRAHISPAGVLTGIDSGVTTAYYITADRCGIDTAAKTIKIVECHTSDVGNLTISQDKLSIYPDPFEDNIIISSNRPIGNITITDMLGKLVYTTCSLSNTLSVDLSALLPGIYILFDNDRHEPYKLIKQ